MRALLPLALLIGWEWGARTGGLNPFLLPAPSAIAATLAGMAASGELMRDLAESLSRVGIGFALAAAIGVPLGLAIGLSKTANHAFAPVVQFFRPISPLAWIPLAILWFGVGNGPSYFLTMIAAFFPIVLNTHFGVRSIATQHLRVARCFQAGRWLTLRRVIWPAALPFIASGCRIGLGIAWMALVGAEMISAHSGLGYLVHVSQDLLRTDRVIAGMIAIGAAGFTMDFCLRKIERRLCPWVEVRA
jgi:ABC-type nitrate/sulfonate/bicarbonate transport system permease component